MDRNVPPGREIAIETHLTNIPEQAKPLVPGEPPLEMVRCQGMRMSLRWRRINPLEDPYVVYRSQQRRHHFVWIINVLQTVVNPTFIEMSARLEIFCLA